MDLEYTKKIILYVEGRYHKGLVYWSRKQLLGITEIIDGRGLESQI
jgi:hypothetical protein